jgi:hypothetical protein
VWTAGLAVAAGAGVATAHGLYQVAVAARVPTPIAWLYPLITDGLALVAYAATSRLHDGGRRYAAGIVVLAAGLSGLAQAIYLAGGIATSSVAPVGLRFGVGAWPAVAAALTAHLLHLIGAAAPAADHAEPLTPTRQDPSSDAASNPAGVQPFRQPDVQPYNPGAVQPPRTSDALNTSAVQPERSTPGSTTRTAGLAGPASERARQAARTYYARHGRLPTATELMQLAQVARGTAGTVLKDLRRNRPALHLVNAETDLRTDK